MNNPFKLLFQAFDELLPLSVSEHLNAKIFLAMPVHCALISSTESLSQCYTPNILQALSPANPGLRKLLISDIIVHDPVSTASS
jgi:hypothetical protein